MHVLTENEVRNLAQRIPHGGRYALPVGAILTPLARDYLRGRGIDVVEAAGSADAGETPAPQGQGVEALVEAVASEVTRALRSPSPPAGEGSGVRGEPAAAPLPSPARSEASASRAVVWAIGGDRPGILAAVAELLGRHKINILEISQTILSGVFAMVMVVDVSKSSAAFGDLKKELESLGTSMGINLSAQRDEIFQYMHRI